MLDLLRPRTAQLRIASWNVLADAYFEPTWYPLTDEQYLQPRTRTSAILTVIKDLNADVILLQEAEQHLYASIKASFPEHETRFCQKGSNKPDGALAILRPGMWTINSETRLQFRTASRLGHVAQILDLQGPDHAFCRIANVHMRYMPPGTPADTHVSMYHMRELLKEWLPPTVPAVIAGDLNDRPSGPIREMLIEAGFTGADETRPTMLHEGIVQQAIDVIACGNGVELASIAPYREPKPPMPGPDFPSDHVPLVAAVRVPSNSV